MAHKVIQVALCTTLLIGEQNPFKKCTLDHRNRGYMRLAEFIHFLEKYINIEEDCVMGTPFLSDDSANQFLGLKRQIYSPDYWDPNHSQNAWGHTLAEQASETCAALRTTDQYYMDLGCFVFDPSTAQDHIKSYTDTLQQTGAHLQREVNKYN